MNIRLDRQTRIDGWRQDRLDAATLVIAGDNLTADLLALAASALGVRKIRLIRPELAKTNIDLLAVARAVQPSVELMVLETPLVNKSQHYLLEGASILVDVSSFGISKKLAVDWMHQRSVPGLLIKQDPAALSVFRYARGRETTELGEMLGGEPLPHRTAHVDPVLAMVAAGIALEEIKNILMEKPSIEGLIKYSTDCKDPSAVDLSAIRPLVIGAGALGNIVCLLLDLVRAGRVDILDFDTVDETNLNRQVLLHGSIGREKAAVLADRLSIPAQAMIHRFDAKTPLRGYDVVLDCVDKFETRALISDRCEREKKNLVSGGTNYTAGQVVAFVPESGSGSGQAPAKRLNFQAARPPRQARPPRSASCIAAPDPSVIMSNMIIGAVMVNELRRIATPQNYLKAPFRGIVAYKADEPGRLSVLGDTP